MSLTLADIGVADALLPYRSQRWDNGGHEQHYLDEGSGEPLVMVHGNPSWCFLWRNAIGALRSDYRCIAPDHIGCGLSSRPTDADYAFTFERRVADFGRFMDHLALDRPVTIVAHDWGGMISMAWAVQNPGRVGRICLFNTGAFPNPHIKRLPWQLWLVRNTPIGAALVSGLNAFAVGAAYTAVTRKALTPELRAAFVAPYAKRESRLATLRFVQDIPLAADDRGYGLVAATGAGLKQFAATPVFLGWGLKDFVFDESFLKTFEQAWPQAEVHRVADGGHYVLEDAGDELLPLLADFLRRSAPVTGSAAP